MGQLDNSTTILTFIIVAFCMALVLIFKKETIPPQLRRGLALLALVMVAFAFVLIVYSFATI